MCFEYLISFEVRNKIVGFWSDNDEFNSQTQIVDGNDINNI